MLQETREYFADTGVIAAIVPREGGTEDSITQKFTKGNMFTHHQKSVIVDAQDPRCALTSQFMPRLGICSP